MKYIFGNWKMAQGQTKAREFVGRWNFENPEVTASVFPSFVHLSECSREKKSGLQIGAQDCSSEMEGAFTGEVSARVLAEIGVRHCLVGHSERRARFHEDNSVLSAKLHQLKLVGITPVFCCGETLEMRQKGHVFQVLESQLEALKGLGIDYILAYEPVWAIGTGVTAELPQIEEVHRFLSQKLPGVPLLYGGSVKLENAESILGISQVHGLLIGGASLQREVFEEICTIAGRLKS